MVYSLFRFKLVCLLRHTSCVVAVSRGEAHPCEQLGFEPGAIAMASHPLAPYRPKAGGDTQKQLLPGFPPLFSMFFSPFPGLSCLDRPSQGCLWVLIPPPCNLLLYHDTGFREVMGSRISWKCLPRIASHSSLVKLQQIPVLKNHLSPHLESFAQLRNQLIIPFLPCDSAFPHQSLPFSPKFSSHAKYVYWHAV